MYTVQYSICEKGNKRRYHQDKSINPSIHPSILRKHYIALYVLVVYIIHPQIHTFEHTKISTKKRKRNLNERTASERDTKLASRIECMKLLAENERKKGIQSQSILLT